MSVQTTKNEAMDILKALTAQVTALTAKVDALAASLASAKPGRVAAAGEPVFPNYGASKGQPVRGASMKDLAYYATGARRTLDDPSKERWHDKERRLLEAIEAEIARQGVPEGEPPPHTDADAGAPF